MRLIAKDQLRECSKTLQEPLACAPTRAERGHVGAGEVQCGSGDVHHVVIVVVTRVMEAIEAFGAESGVLLHFEPCRAPQEHRLSDQQTDLKTYSRGDEQLPPLARKSDIETDGQKSWSNLFFCLFVKKWIKSSITRIFFFFFF